MCDYSLMSFPNRLATEGEQLVAHRFPGGAMGFASPADLSGRASTPRSRSATRRSWREVFQHWLAPPAPCQAPAVCLPPGARLFLRDIPKHLQAKYRVGPAAEVTVVHLSESAYTYRDAVRFGNGCELLLQFLQKGQRADVLSISSEAVQEEARLAAAR